MVLTVPHGKTIGFAILKQENSELMLQSVDSLGDDLKLSEKPRAGTVLLYADVGSLDLTLKSNKDGKVWIANRETAYGATECWLKTPWGTILGLAEFSKK